MQYSYLIPLQVALPLFFAPIVALFNNNKISWLISLIISWICFFLSSFLLIKVNLYGPLSYYLGSWSVPVGIEYKVNTFNAFVLFIVSGITPICLTFAFKSLNNETNEERHSLIYSLCLLFLTWYIGYYYK